MKPKQMVPLVLAVVAILMASYGMLSYSWYQEYRETKLLGDEGIIKTDLGYGLRGVQNHTQHKLNGTTLEEEEKVQSYDDFIGKGNEAGPVASRMILLMFIGIVMAVLFIPLVFITQTGGLEDHVGKLGPYIPLYVAQVAAFTLVASPIWFSYEFIMALDMDMYKLTNAPSQALGEMAGLWVIFGGVLIQVAAFMALSRTRLVYIEPLDEVKTPEPME